ncbi:hypothetical protein [Paenibacillus sp. BK720]|uniref:HEAT repeat domain-containing protein n=1 Tax=Paenibacillus sp. BK720 TaxID=2587092 RepID=UPI001ABB4F16|nr:hypothetical protein [Paenibacillus sp. BK720]
MSTINNAKSSDESISFKAHREAEALNDKEMIPILIELINSSITSENKISRREAYFILSKLLLKHMDQEALQFLINQLNLEKDKFVISTLLDRISDLEKPESTDLDPIFQHTQHRNWLIRRSAINSLKRSRNPRAREVILDNILTNKEDIKKNKYDIIYAVSTLSYIGIYDDLALLEELSRSNIRDIKESSIFAIESINKSQ